MKETLHQTEVEVAKQETIKCGIVAACVVLGGLCFLVYGLVWLSTVRTTSEDIYTRRIMAKEISDLYSWKADMTILYWNHTHRYDTGKVK